MLEVDYKITDFFFDRLAVQNRLAAKELRAMSRIGAFIRRGAQKSIRRRKSSSVPGTPPYAHSTDKVATLKNILFGFDPSTHSVVAGPVLLNRPAFGRHAAKLERNNEVTWIEHIKPDKPVTSLTEFGGTATALVNDVETTLTYKARPFMGPALERERKNGKLIEAWKDLL